MYCSLFYSIYFSNFSKDSNPKERYRTTRYNLAELYGALIAYILNIETYSLTNSF